MTFDEWDREYVKGKKQVGPMQERLDAWTAAESRSREAVRLAGLLAVQMESFVGDESYSVANASQDVRMLEAAILSLIPSPSTMEQEGCEWKQRDEGQIGWESACSFVWGKFKDPSGRICQCGKPIITAP